MDSVRALDLIVALETEFGLEISDDDARRFHTVSDVVRFVELGRAA